MSDEKKSNSQAFIENRSKSPPIASQTIANNVSQYRKNAIATEIKQGLWKDGGKTGDFSENKSNGYITSSVGQKKIAQVLSSTPQGIGGGSGGGSYMGANNSFQQGPEIYSPLWLSSNLSLPRDRLTVNAWCRAFFALNPVVQNAINLHSTYPLGKLSIKCHNKDIERFFNEMIEEIDLMNVCVQAAQEYWLLGEVFIYAEYNENLGKWSRLVIQNPDYINIKHQPMSSEPDIMLKPDENLKRLVFSNRAQDRQQQQKLPKHIFDAVKHGKDIVLDSFNTSHLSRKISPYELRGTGLPISVFRNLMLFDMLRESKFAQASGMVNPLTLVKVGSAEFKPTPEYMEQVRNTFEMAQYDKDFKIFSQNDLTIEKIGSGAGIYDISADIQQLLKEIYIGLMVPSVVLDGGADVSYANGGVALDVLRLRYLSFRSMISNWLRKKIFAPISKIQGFFENHDGEKRLIVPEIDWNHMSLFDAGDYIQTLVTLTGGEGGQKRVSNQTLYRSLGLEFEDEILKMRKETIAEVILKKEKEALDSMDLAKLRSLSDEDEIPDIAVEDGGGGNKLPGEDTGGGGDASGAPPPPPAESLIPPA